MKRTILAATALCGLAAAIPAQSAEIEFWHGLSGPSEKALDTICDGFNASQTEDRIVCTGQGSYETLLQKATAAYRADKQPAIVMFYDVGTPTIMLSGAVDPVTDVMKAADAEVDWSDYLYGALNYYATSEGVPMSLPFNASTLLFYANPEKLAAVGVTKIPQTWEDVEKTASALKDKGDKCPLVLQTNNPWRLLEQTSAAQGAAIATGHNGYDGLDAELTFNAGLHLRLMEDFNAWLKEGIAVDQAATRAGKAVQAFATGECAMIMESSGGWGVIRAADAVNPLVGMVPIYADQTRHNTFVGGASLWAMKGFDATTYKAVAHFFAYLRQPEVQAKFALETGYIPVTKSGLAAFKEDPDVDTVTAQVISTGSESLSLVGTPDTRGIRLGFYPQVRQVWIEEVAKAFGSGKDMGEALDTAVKRGNDLLRQFERTYPGARLP